MPTYQICLYLIMTSNQKRKPIKIFLQKNLQRKQKKQKTSTMMIILKIGHLIQFIMKILQGIFLIQNSFTQSINIILILMKDQMIYQFVVDHRLVNIVQNFMTGLANWSNLALTLMFTSRCSNILEIFSCTCLFWQFLL